MHDIEAIDEVVSRNFERDHKSGDYDSQIYDDSIPVSREHDRDYESSVPDYRRLRQGNSGSRKDIGEKTSLEVNTNHDIEVIDELVSRNFERDHEGGDYDSLTYEGGVPISRGHDSDYDYHSLEGGTSAAEELTDGFEVEFGDWLSKFGVDRTTQSPPRRRRLTLDHEVSLQFT